MVFDHAYHGRTNLTMALTAKNMPYRDGFGPFAPEVYRVPMSYPLRDPEGMTGEQAAARAIEQIERLVGADNVACVLIEPIQGEGGFVVPAPGFLPALAAWARRAGALFVADEIQTGFCRTGRVVRLRTRVGGARPRHHGQGPGRRACRWPPSPGGPSSWTACTPGGSGGTYGGNPVACAAALASIGTMEEEGPGRGGPAASARSSAPACATLQQDHPGIGDVRGRGAMMAMELVRPGTLDPDAEATRRIVRGLPPGRCGRALLWELRQRDPAAAASGHRRGPAG